VILISPNRNRKIERHKSVIIPKYIQTVRGVLGTAITEIRTYEEEKGNFMNCLIKREKKRWLSKICPKTPYYYNVEIIIS